MNWLNETWWWDENDQEWSVAVAILIKIPLCKVLPQTFSIKRLSELGRFRRESDMRGLTALTLLFLASILWSGVAGQSYYPDQYCEGRLANLLATLVPTSTPRGGKSPLVRLLKRTGVQANDNLLIRGLCRMKNGRIVIFTVADFLHKRREIEAALLQACQ